MDLRSQIDVERLPQHIAIIMDGNGRWAKEHNMPRVFGHRNGVKAVREATEAAAEIGIKYLTLYAFSTENWKRPKYEVGALMKLLVDTLHNEVKTLNKNNIKLQAIGDLERLPPKTLKALREGIESTKNNNRMTLVLALNYSAKWEILEATKAIAMKTRDGKLEPDDIDENIFNNALSTQGIPDPELLIRTSGETRLSNFLLWQIAYAELYFTPVYWPDFDKEKFYKAIIEFQNRERRFGKTSEQLKT
ncbi:MAG: isoprenyl transferase [Saprospiraceae bacterium]|nr:isoprenyl transferase [Saprospiraceae bacterium]MCB9324751.1 isoprenyl transferase [Lewinellaceae bacterium]